jgi:hypothetical protein
MRDDTESASGGGELIVITAVEAAERLDENSGEQMSTWAYMFEGKRPLAEDPSVTEVEALPRPERKRKRADTIGKNGGRDHRVSCYLRDEMWNVSAADALVTGHMPAAYRAERAGIGVSRK